MKADYHLHTEYSYDSRMKAKELVDKALALNYDLIAVTEHLDLLPNELLVYGLPAFKKYCQGMQALKERLADTPLKLLCGIEVGDYNRVRPFADCLLEQLDLDLVMGAVHFLNDFTNVAVPLKAPLTPSEIVSYYRLNLDLVQHCKIDVIAHLGVYKRYYEDMPDESFCRDILKDIFQTMVERGIALEINFSSLRKPYARILPEEWQIELYMDCGGSLFTLGSDSHLLEHFDLNYDKLPQWLFDGSLQFPRF
ncbi:MAG: histidinol-phosphatase HisJ family protein [Candidatus Cloacimonadota bacterium]|jgi:histidinol-phosphatase (PHP family)|nr:histidinol-phosphatase HisJ family protein [Candidatus Cloacimonadota bacterium]OQC08324.1 MAG: Histidinol-phosphatase [Candidatus Cloacimonetes bacterium ADurb.Bin088]